MIDVLSDLFILRGVPGHIRSDNGPEFIAKVLQDWIAAVGAKTAYIATGSPWEMYRSSDEAKADVFDYIERFYNPKRRHSTIGYMSFVEFERQAGLA